MSEANFYVAAMTLVQAVADDFSPPLPVGFSESFTPPDASANVWFEARLFGGQATKYALEAGGVSLVPYTLRVGVARRVGYPLAEAYAVADAVVSAFASGTVVGAGRVEQPPSIGGEIVTEDRAILPVDIRVNVRIER